MNRTRGHLVTIVLSVAILLLTGCQWRMMPTPVAYRDANEEVLSPPQDAPPDTTIEILYATDRNSTESAIPTSAYGSRRGLSLRLGVATVRLGDPGLTWDELARQSLHDRRPPMRLIELDEIGKLWTTIPLSDDRYAEVEESTAPDDPIREASRRFAALIRERLDRSSKGEIILYVPGFNTPFEAPIQMMAQFAHFMGRDGVFIAYSWPARDTMRGYSKQMTTSIISERNLRQFLIFLAEETDAERIHVISYSAGAPIVTSALLQLRLMHADSTLEEIRSSLRIGHVVYAGADQDLDYFRNLFLDQFDDIAESITIYTSRKDIGLLLSRVFATGTPRLGRAISDLTENDLAQLRQGSVTSFVDVTDAKRAGGRGDLWAHAYWYLNAWVSMDVIALLRYDLPPPERGLRRGPDEAIWSFPIDYPEQVREISNAWREADER
ncbi:MAG: alpha/beta hydrolase [Planctomycetota bacterium]|jgi:esterase/lipase superfamily enzyme